MSACAWIRVFLLTHWGQDKMAAISQTMLANAFSWMEMCEFCLRFHWSLFPEGPINDIQSLVQVMAWRRPGDKPLSEPMRDSLPTHICVTRPQWVKQYLTIAPVPAKQPWWIWINTSCEFIMNDCVTTTKQSTTKSFAYFLGYTVSWWSWKTIYQRLWTCLIHANGS